MHENSRDMIKTRCDSIGIVLRVLFWGYVLYVLVMIGFGIWMLFQSPNNFVIRVVDTGNGLAGFGFLNGGFEIDFAKNVLNTSAAKNPKLTYAIGFFDAFIANLLTLAVLWNIRNIFKSIDENDTPFIKINCRAIFYIGVIVIILGFIKSGLLPTVFGILKMGAGGSVNNYWRSLMAGGIIICLSYMFEYGTSLQIESNETL